MTKPETYIVETHRYGIWRIIAVHLNNRCVHMTESDIEAHRMRDELDRAYREGFYHGLLTGHGETQDRRGAA